MKVYRWAGLVTLLVAQNLLAAVAWNDQQARSAVFLWEAATSLEHPSYIYYAPDQSALYVASLGAPGADPQNGGGWIDVLSLTGVPVSAKWIDKLKAPRGMIVLENVLWIADQDRLVRIDVRSGRALEPIPVAGALMLTGLAVDTNGRIFVSDPLREAIFLVEDGGVAVFAEGPHLERPTGLAVFGAELIVAGFGNPGEAKRQGHLYRLNLYNGAKRLVVSEALGHPSGLAVDSQGNYFISDWVNGTISMVSRSGARTVLFEGLSGVIGLASLPDRQLAATRSENDSVVVFDLKRHPSL